MRLKERHDTAIMRYNTILLAKLLYAEVAPVGARVLVYRVPVTRCVSDRDSVDHGGMHQAGGGSKVVQRLALFIGQKDAVAGFRYGGSGVLRQAYGHRAVALGYFKRLQRYF